MFAQTIYNIKAIFSGDKIYAKLTCLHISYIENCVARRYLNILKTMTAGLKKRSSPNSRALELFRTSPNYRVPCTVFEYFRKKNFFIFHNDRRDDFPATKQQQRIRKRNTILINNLCTRDWPIQNLNYNTIENILLLLL